MKIIIAVLIVVFLLGIVLLCRSRLFKRKCLYAFNSTFEGTAYDPQYKLSWLYGNPAFTITFNSEKELASAKNEGLTKRFSEKIQNICAGFGGKSNPFDAGLAIWYTSTK